MSDLVLKAFPLLKEAAHIRRLASPVPLVPDAVFDIFIVDSKGFFALVSTDYADPQEQGRELGGISGQYEFDFLYLVRPFGGSGEIKILPHDEMDDDFFVVVSRGSQKVYCYLAALSYK